MDQKIYYYIRDKDNHPIVTVCLLKNGSDITRGTAICSRQDIPWKEYGRALAFKRAMKTMKAEENLFMVVRTEILEILESLEVPEDFFEWKGFFNPRLSLYETHLLFGSEEK